MDEGLRIFDTWEFGCNRCFICNAEYKHSKIITEYEDGLQEVEFRYSHARCEKVRRRFEKSREKLINAEFDFFCLKFNQYQ
jgi:hypothetical protein